MDDARADFRPHLAPQKPLKPQPRGPAFFSASSRASGTFVRASSWAFSSTSSTSSLEGGRAGLPSSPLELRVPLFPLFVVLIPGTQQEKGQKGPTGKPRGVLAWIKTVLFWSCCLKA